MVDGRGGLDELATRGRTLPRRRDDVLACFRRGPISGVVDRAALTRSVVSAGAVASHRRPVTTFGSLLRWAMSGAVSAPEVPRLLFTCRRSEVSAAQGCTAPPRGANEPDRYRFPWENTVSVFKYAVAAAVGYYVGRPNGRWQVQRLREQAVELVRGPRAKQLKERGWDIAVERASAAIKRAQRRRANGSAAALDLSDTASRRFGDAAASELSGFGGRTVAEDTEAVRLGITPPAPVGRIHDDVDSI